MGFRRVVTGHSSNGASVVLTDETIESIDVGAGSPVDLMLALDAAPAVPNDGRTADITQWFPAEGGLRVFTWVKEPGSTAGTKPKPGAQVLDLRSSASFDEENPGMHASQTVDVNLVLSGELWLELDDGVVVHLGPGDVVLQNGTRHKWENRTDDPTTVLCVTVGARRA